MENVSVPSKIYPARTGIGLEGIAERINNAEHAEISDDEVSVLIDLGHELIIGNFGQEHVGSEKSLTEIYKTPATTEEQKFYLDYFTVGSDTFEKIKDYLPKDTEMQKDEQVGRMIADRTTLGVDNTQDPNAVIASLDNVELINGLVSSSERKKISERSAKFIKAALAYCIVKGMEPSELGIDAEQTLVVNYQPEKLVDKFEDLEAYHRFLLLVRKQLKSESDENGDLQKSRVKLADMHLARVNEMILGVCNNAINLIDQSGRNPENAQLTSLVARIESAMPVLHRLEGTAHSDAEDSPRARFIKRMDYLRNGAVLVGDEEGRSKKLSVISKELKALVERVESGETGEIQIEGILPAEVVNELDKIVWNAEELKEFLVQVLIKWNVHSEFESTWEEAEQRTGWAADNKVQVVITPKSDSLAYDSSKGVLKVAETYLRNLTNTWPAGALVATVHEGTHVLQSFFDRKISQNIPLAETKGRHSSAMKETGGLAQEAAMQWVYFGRKRPDNMHYYHALEAKLAGGSLIDAAKAFYVSDRKNSSLTDDNIAAYTAVDRTLRFYREGGVNSQPLDYLESGLLTEALASLPAKERNELIMVSSSFDLKDTVELMELGLIELPKLDFDPVEDVITTFMENWYGKYSQVKS